MINININNHNYFEEKIESICNEIRLLIIKKNGNSDLKSIAKNMGYNNSKKGVVRIGKVINDSAMDLLSPNFDGVFSSKCFLYKLIETIELNDDFVLKNLKKVDGLITDALFGFTPYIFCVTNFVRDGQPIFALAALESRRRIYLPKIITRKIRAVKLDMVRQIIKRHQSETNGEIDLWGTVVKYICHFDKENVVTFLPDGSIIDEKNEEVKHGGASILLGSKIIMGIDNNSTKG